MKISLILTTQGDRKSDIERFFNSISNNVYKEIEIIFVDQSNNNELEEVINSNKYLKKITKYIKINKSPLSVARNIGISHITGDIIAFPDDDCWYDNDFLNRVRLKFEKNSDLDVICASVYDPINKRRYGEKRKSDKNIEIVTLNNVFIYPISVGLFIKYRSIEDIKFDENLGAGCRWGSSEETDLIISLIIKNYKIGFIDKLQVFHPVEDVKESDINRYLTYGRGTGALISKWLINQNLKMLNKEYYISNIKSIAGVILYRIKDETRYRMYKNRLIGTIEGYREAKKYYMK